MEPKTVEEIDDMFRFIDENIEDVKTAFAMFDKNGDGTIASKTLVTVMRCLGFNPTEDEIEDMINEVDVDGNGVIDFIEFLQMMNKVWSGVDETIRAAFELFDNDGSGAINMEEFKDAIMDQDQDMTDEDEAPITADEVTTIITGVDVDGDGQVNLEEFVNMLKE